MRRKLNPDGAKVRTLRIQRGWTQEQLAEIAGVSPRTVQRAETANCAAFETVRAMAAAFETDFDQLLLSEDHRASDRGPQVANPEPMRGSGREIERIPAAPSTPPARRARAIPFLSVSILVLGMALGAILSTHFNAGVKRYSPEPPNPALVSQAAKTLKEPVRQITVARQEVKTTKVPSQPTKAAAPKHPVMDTESAPESNPGELQSEVPVMADPGSREIVHRSQASASLDLPTHSHTLLPELVLPAAPALSGDIPVLSVDRALDEPDSGAVRQAVDLAARKTGAFVSKVSTSLRRVF